jgi:hypothetical protein
MAKHKLDTRWFKEDRVPGDATLTKEQSQQTEDVIRNSSIIRERLIRIIEEDIAKTFEVEENFDDPAWKRKTIAAAAERKTLRRYHKLLNL